MKNWSNYQESTYNDDISNLLVEFLDKNKVKTAIDLGCGSGNETVYMLKKGIKVLAVDRQLNNNYILDRLEESEKVNVSFMQSSFEDISLPKTDLVAAFFSIPFCEPDKFDLLWNKIFNSLNTNGYFIGQLFGDRSCFKEFKDVSTFTKEEVNEYLKDYKIIKLEEVDYIREIDNKRWHYFEIIVQKN